MIDPPAGEHQGHFNVIRGGRVYQIPTRFGRDARMALRLGDPRAWRAVILCANRLIRAHVEASS
jgi:hypothetical protein